MTIILTGAGSGGHITPVLAVAHELKRQHPKARLVYVGQKGDSLGDIPAQSPDIDEVMTVRAGKWRRYHGEGLKQLLDIKTMLLNARDLFYTLAGLWQSRRLLKAVSPNVVFIKGGFVGVPVGLASALAGIPYITHDSDAMPGLANRIISRWASKHAVALPEDVYHYPAAKTITTGIPLQAGFEPVTAQLKSRYRREIGIPQKAKFIFVIGGGLGSQRVNHAVAEALPHLLAEFPDLYVAHSAGRQNLAEMEVLYDERLTKTEQGRLSVHGYIDDVYRYSGAADLVITRAGATNLAEFALQGRACIVIPSPFLAGGHQLKNADYLASQMAATVLDEAQLLQDPLRLARLASGLLKNPAKLDKLESNLAKFAKPEASTDLARLILESAREVK